MKENNRCNGLDNDPAISDEFINKTNRIIANATRLSARATVVVAFFSIISAVVSYCQLGVIHGQLEEMRSSSQQTDRLIIAATNQSSAATKIAELAQRTVIESSRARISPSVASIEWGIKLGGPIMVAVQYEHVGRNAANNLNFYIGAKVAFYQD